MGIYAVYTSRLALEKAKGELATLRRRRVGMRCAIAPIMRVQGSRSPFTYSGSLLDAIVHVVMIKPY